MRIVIRLMLGALALAAIMTAGTAQPRVVMAAPEPHVVAAVPAGDLVIPVAGVLKQALKGDFNDIHNGHRHEAIDILAPRGTPVLASVDGSIRKLFDSRAGGLTIYEYDVQREKSYYYAHLDHYAENLSEGMAVRQGDVLGYVGTTGNAPANTPHLHFAITILPPNKAWSKGEAIDPYPILTARGVTR
jgi:murein DD-endopeptidase MepM/ murein hydrolase activator NlpD